MNLSDFSLDLTGVGIVPSKDKKPCLVPASSLELSTHPDDYALRIDNSTLEKFQSCPRSAKFYTIDRRSTKLSEPLVAGGALHQGLEHLYKNNLDPSSLPTAIALAEQWYLDHPVPFSWRTPDLVTKALRSYVSEYEGNDPFTIVEYQGAPFVERGFEIELGKIEIGAELQWTQKYLTNQGEDKPLKVRNLYIVWMGKIDLLVRDMLGLRVMDHKTSSIMGESFWRAFELGQQPLGYVWAGNKIFGEMPRGFLANVIYWRPPLKNQTMGRVEFYRQNFNYDQARVDEWERDVMASVSDFVANMVRGHYPGYRMWCTNKYGMCPYHEVCTIDEPDQRMAMLDCNLFDNVDWDPTVQ